MDTDTPILVVMCVLAFLFGSLTGLWLNSGSSGATNVNYQMKYAEEVCKQRNANVHLVKSLNYIFCMDKNTKVLSDFD